MVVCSREAEGVIPASDSVAQVKPWFFSEGRHLGKVRSAGTAVQGRTACQERKKQPCRPAAFHALQLSSQPGHLYNLFLKLHKAEPFLEASQIHEDPGSPKLQPQLCTGQGLSCKSGVCFLIPGHTPCM